MHGSSALAEEKRVQRRRGRSALCPWELMSSEHSSNMLWVGESFDTKVNEKVSQKQPVGSEWRGGIEYLLLNVKSEWLF